VKRNLLKKKKDFTKYTFTNLTELTEKDVKKRFCYCLTKHVVFVFVGCYGETSRISNSGGKSCQQKCSHISNTFETGPYRVPLKGQNSHQILPSRGITSNIIRYINLFTYSN